MLHAASTLEVQLWQAGPSCWSRPVHIRPDSQLSLPLNFHPPDPYGIHAWLTTQLWKQTMKPREGRQSFWCTGRFGEIGWGGVGVFTCTVGFITHNHFINLCKMTKKTPLNGKLLYQILFVCISGLFVLLIPDRVERWFAQQLSHFQHKLFSLVLRVLL